MNDKVKYVLIAVIFVLLFAIAVLAYYSLSSQYEAETPVQDNMETSTDFAVLDERGGSVKLSDFYGKPTVVNFWATWCGPCRSEFPAFEKMYKKYGDDVNFMMVNMTDGFQETVESAKAFVNDNGYTFPVYFDTNYEAANAYSVNAVPMTLFIDSSGYIVETYTGAMSESALEKYIEKIVGDEQ